MKIYNKSCIFSKENEFIDEAICEAQNLYWEEQDKKSNFSHIGFVGNDDNFYESTVKIRWKKIERKFLWWKVKVPELKFVYGINITNKEKKFKNCKDKYKKLVIQYNFKNVTKKQWEGITNQGRKLYNDKIKYGGIELFGTLFTLIEWKLTKDKNKRKEILKRKNPFNTSNVYCCAFVIDCFKSVGLNYINPKIDSSVSTVDEGYYNCQLKCILKDLLGG